MTVPVTQNFVPTPESSLYSTLLSFNKSRFTDAGMESGTAYSVAEQDTQFLPFQRLV